MNFLPSFEVLKHLISRNYMQSSYQSRSCLTATISHFFLTHKYFVTKRETSSTWLVFFLQIQIATIVGKSWKNNVAHLYHRNTYSVSVRFLSELYSPLCRLISYALHVIFIFPSLSPWLSLMRVVQTPIFTYHFGEGHFLVRDNLSIYVECCCISSFLLLLRWFSKF